MGTNSGKTFWDLVHENNIVKYTLLAIILIIIIAIFFFIAKGYTVTTSGITPPHENLDSTISIERVRATKANTIQGNSQLNQMSQMIWLTFFLQIIIILIGVLTFVTQITLKPKEGHYARTEKKVEVFEHLYNTYVSFTLVDREQSGQLLNDIQKFSRYVVVNGLYIDKQLMRLTNEVTDYFKEVIVDFRKKDLAKEKVLQDKFKSLFNK